MFFTLGSVKGFLLGVWFSNVGWDSHGEWGKTLHIYEKFGIQKIILKFKKIVFHDVKIPKF